MWWLIRSVRSTPWKQSRTAGVENDEIQRGAGDLAPRPKDDGGLSVFQVENCEDEKHTGILYAVLVRKPQTTHFLRIRPEHFAGLQYSVAKESSKDQHPYLRDRHRNIYGLADPQTREKLARAILFSGPQVLTFTYMEVKDEGRKLLQQVEYKSFFAFPDAYR